MTVQPGVAAVESDGGFRELTAVTASPKASRQIHRHSLEFAGVPIDLLVAGDDLAQRLIRPFAHLEITSPSDSVLRPSMTFVDGEATGADPMLPPPGAEWVSEGEGWRVSVHGAWRYISETRKSSLICLDRATGSVAALFRSATHLTLADQARPLQRMMGQICTCFGVQSVHAGLVARDGKGVLIVGGSGQGKTTTAIDCFAGGLDFMADDSAAIGETPERGFTGYSLYSSARVLPDQVSRWPSFADRWQSPQPTDDKALLMPAEVSPERVARRCRIIAIMVPTITGGPFRVTPASPRQAFSALVFDSEEVRRSRMSRAEFRRLVKLTKEVPCFMCELGNDPAAVAAGMADFIGSSR